MKKTSGVIFLFLCSATLCIGQEICDNGIDDDGDSLIDLMDDECDCVDLFDDTVYLPNGDFENTLKCCGTDFSAGDCLENWMPINGSPEHIDPTCFDMLSETEEAKGVPIEDNFIGASYEDFGARVFKETFGTCTNATLIANNRYRLSFEARMSSKEEFISGDGNAYLYFYGLRTCEELVFTSGAQGDLCDLGFDLVPLDSVGFDDISFTEWSSFTKDFRPSADINAIIIAFDCKEDFRYDTKRFIYIDDIAIAGLLNQEFEYDLNIDGQGSLCDNDFMMTTTAVTGVSYQWYKDEVAIVGETGSNLSISRNESLSGSYLLRITDADGCYETDPVDVEIGSTAQDTSICFGRALDISTGSYTSDGVYNEDVMSTFSCVNKTYNLTIEDLIVGDTIRESYQEGASFSFEGVQYSDEGNYDITLKTAAGCDSLVTLALAEVDFTIRVPNIFTPNLLTDNKLTVYGKRGSATIVRKFMIYDRWGNEMFSKQNFEPNLVAEGWDGKHTNKVLRQGIYSYFVEMEFIDGTPRTSAGTFLLVE